MKKTLKIIGFIIVMVLMIAGIILYYPLILPIAVLLLCSNIKTKQKEPPSEIQDDVEIFEIIDE